MKKPKPFKAPKPAKYKNKRIVVDGLTFDSQGEAKRWFELKRLQHAKVISHLERQVDFTLLPSVKYTGSKRATPAMKYRADFVYIDAEGREIVEDFKGFMTSAFNVKRHMMKALLNIDILITGVRK